MERGEGNLIWKKSSLKHLLRKNVRTNYLSAVLLKASLPNLCAIQVMASMLYYIAISTSAFCIEILGMLEDNFVYELNI